MPITVGAWSCASNWPCWAPAQSRLSRLSGAPSGAVSARGHSRSTTVGLLPVQNWLRRPRDHGLHQWSASVNWWATDYSAPDSAAQYCDERVRLSVCLSVCGFVCVCLSAIISSDLHVRSSPIRFVHVTYGRGSVLLWRCSDMLCTSGFVDNVMLAHKPR